MSRSLRSLWAAPCIAAIVLAPPASAELVLADGGRASVRIVLAADAIPAERTAAEELARYLGQVTGAAFEITEEGSPARGTAIHVGPTHFARVNGIEPAGLAAEEWIVRSAGRDLILCGGRPRGTLYAVFHFLEDQIGVRWWTPHEELVPRRPTLRFGRIDDRGRPAFLDRDLHGLPFEPAFAAHNRLNGDSARLPWSYGGGERYGPPNHNHDFFLYLPPEDWFEEYPEYYSELEGEREPTQLCLTNRELGGILASKLRGYVEQSRAEAAARNEPPPRLFSFSPNDRGGSCRCSECREVADHEHSGAGPLVLTLNRLADSIAESHPDVLLSTLAYRQTLLPPRHATLRDRVVVRFAALYERNFLEPLAVRRHRPIRRALEGWRRVARHLRVWDYAVTFGDSPNNFPLPNLPALAADLRYYHQQGVEGVLLQVDHPSLSDLRDLKVWVLARLLEDPERDLDGLVREFTERFYGAAGADIRTYLDELTSAARRRRAEIEYPTRASQYTYLDRAFLMRAHSTFDRAESRVAGSEQLRARVRRGRISLDRATLWLWREVFGPLPAVAGLDARAVSERLRATVGAEITRTWPESSWAGQVEALEREIETALARLDHGSKSD